MQGTLNEIDIRSILQLIEVGQRTGELLVEASRWQRHDLKTDSSSVSPFPSKFYGNSPSDLIQSFWFVFFINGQIVYAADSGNNSLLRLRDYLRYYQQEDILKQYPSPSLVETNVPEYAYLWFLLENHLLTPQQGRAILQSMVSETLFDLLSLHQGFFIFEMGPALAPQLTTLEIAPLMTKSMKQIQQWKQFHPHIQSPHQCPTITDEEQLRTSLSDNAYLNLTQWADGKTSLRQLSRYLNRDLLAISRAVYPYIQRGWIQLLGGVQPDTVDSPQSWETESSLQVPHVVCIDDDLTVRQSVDYILHPQGYHSTGISNPLEALNKVFQLQPDLILCDIAMPELDGYELCAMLRQSSAFRQTPIIMLTGKDGFIDRVRARMVGSTDYLTKPFGENELLMLLEKYIGSGMAVESSSSLDQEVSFIPSQLEKESTSESE